MRVRILETAAYGRLEATERQAGEEVPAAQFGDLEYIMACVESGHIEIIEDGERLPETLASLPAAPVINGKGEVVAAGGIDATDAALSLADSTGVDLSKVKGTGKGGKILLSDVQEIAGKSEG